MGGQGVGSRGRGRATGMLWWGGGAGPKKKVRGSPGVGGRTPLGGVGGRAVLEELARERPM